MFNKSIFRNDHNPYITREIDHTVTLKNYPSYDVHEYMTASENSALKYRERKVHKPTYYDNYVFNNVPNNFNTIVDDENIYEQIIEDPNAETSEIPNRLYIPNDIDNRFFRKGPKINLDLDDDVRYIQDITKDMSKKEIEHTLPTLDRNLMGPINEKFVNVNTQMTNNIESFTYSNEQDKLAAPIMIEHYLMNLVTRAQSVCFYLRNNKSFAFWKKNWDLLYDNLYKKNNLLFEKLDETDSDIAYVINKGEEVKFRIRDNKRFMPINVYQYVLYHEMAHMSTHELQHTKGFFELLSLICVAAMELGFIELSKINSSKFETNSQAILSKGSIKEELCNGCDLIINASPQSKPYYEELKDYIKRK